MCAVWHEVSRSMCRSTHRRVTGALPKEGFGALASSESSDAAPSRLRSQATR